MCVLALLCTSLYFGLFDTNDSLFTLPFGAVDGPLAVVVAISVLQY